MPSTTSWLPLGPHPPCGKPPCRVGRLARAQCPARDGGERQDDRDKAAVDGSLDGQRPAPFQRR
jgi:hypothetical protein